jgi:hypothetical protein
MGGSRHVGEQVGEVMMGSFFWDRQSDAKGRSVQEASVDQFLKEEFYVSQFGILDA